jgi:hypothetical protein
VSRPSLPLPQLPRTVGEALQVGAVLPGALGALGGLIADVWWEGSEVGCVAVHMPNATTRATRWVPVRQLALTCQVVVNGPIRGRLCRVVGYRRRCGSQGSMVRTETSPGLYGWVCESKVTYVHWTPTQRRV